MRIFNKEKTQEVFNPNLEFGSLKDDRIQTGATQSVDAVQEQGHYEVENQKFNADGSLFGQERKWVVDVASVPFKPSEPIIEDIKVYIEFTSEELKEKKEQKFFEKHKAEYEELNNALDFLSQTDYKAIQFAEGAISAVDFELIKQNRQEKRAKVRILQNAISLEKVKESL